MPAEPITCGWCDQPVTCLNCMACPDCNEPCDCDPDYEGEEATR